MIDAPTDCPSVRGLTDSFILIYSFSKIEERKGFECLDEAKAHKW